MSEYSGDKISQQEAVDILKQRYPDANEMVMSLNTDPPNAVLGLPVQHNSIVIHEVRDGQKEWLLEIEGRPRSRSPGDIIDEALFPINEGGHTLKALIRNDPAVSEDIKTLAQGHPAEMIPTIIVALKTAVAVNAEHDLYNITDLNCNTAAGEIARTAVGAGNIPDMEGWEPGKETHILTDQQRDAIRFSVYDETYIDDATLMDQFRDRLEEAKNNVFNIDSKFARMSPQDLLEYPPTINPDEAEPAVAAVLDEVARGISDKGYQEGINGTAYTAQVSGLSKGGEPQVDLVDGVATIDGKSMQNIFQETAQPDESKIEIIDAKTLKEEPIAKIDSIAFKQDLGVDN